MAFSPKRLLQRHSLGVKCRRSPLVARAAQPAIKERPAKAKKVATDHEDALSKDGPLEAVLLEAEADSTPAGEAPMSVTPDDASGTALRDIVFVASEAAPFSKTGGLGDVCGSLPKALAARGHRVMVVVPYYDQYEGAEPTHVVAQVDEMEWGYFHQSVDGVDFVFVAHDSFNRPGGMYGDAAGAYGDNQWRFKLLCLAALEAPLRLPLGEDGLYGQDPVFVANDWFAGLVPVYLAARYRAGGIYLGARTVLLIHNLAHQGVFPPGTFDMLCLPNDWYDTVGYQYPPEQRQGAYEEEGHAINTLKGAITTADRIVAVSPGFAYEVQTPLGGKGMEDLLSARQFKLNGVLNGIDEDVWNPETDPEIPENYSAEDLEGKAACKVALQKEVGLPERPDVPLVAFIGRLDAQKGADIILEAAPWLLDQGAQLVCLGTGDAALEDGLRQLESEYHDKARGWVGFNVAFSHRLTAAADILLMPSRFEPCGLNQMYAMKYGTVPVAHATGGLRDTVITYDPKSPAGSTGFAFEGCTADSLKGSLWAAMQLFQSDKAAWEQLMRRGMARDSSWDKAAAQYEQIFEWAQLDMPQCG